MQSSYKEKTLAEKKKFWEEQIHFWQESGLSQSEYCRRHSIRQSQWFYWRRRCRGTEAALTFVPIKLPSLNGHPRQAPVIRIITPNGFTIEIDVDAPTASLTHLIREVATL